MGTQIKKIMLNDFKTCLQFACSSVQMVVVELHMHVEVGIGQSNRGVALVDSSAGSTVFEFGRSGL